eukprot:6647161-Pyramimonas_sp.AAC.1
MVPAWSGRIGGAHLQRAAVVVGSGEQRGGKLPPQAPHGHRLRRRRLHRHRLLEGKHAGQYLLRRCHHRRHVPGGSCQGRRDRLESVGPAPWGSRTKGKRFGSLKA